MATENTKVVKSTKDYLADLDATTTAHENASKILASDKYTSVTFDLVGAGFPKTTWAGASNPTSAVIQANGDLLITFGYNDGTNNVAKEVTIEGYAKDGKAKSSIKYVNFITSTDLTGNPVTQQFNLADYASYIGSTVLDGSAVKGSSLQGTLFGDNIDLSAKGTAGKKGYTINAGNGDDTITASKGNDTIIGGKGDNVLDIKLANGAFGDDVVTLTKGENLTIYLDTFDTAITKVNANTQAGFLNNISAKFEKNDLVLTVYTDSANIATTTLGTLTIKNYKTTDTTGANGSVTLKTSNGGNYTFDLKDWDFATSVAADNLKASDKSFKGTWIDDNIDATGVTSDKLTIAAGEGANTIIGHAKDDVVTAGKGDDTYTVTAGNDKVTLGAGQNTINVSTAAAFGTTEVVLTKGEQLKLVVTNQTGANADQYLEYGLADNGKDLVISVYNDSTAANHDQAHLTGTLLVKNYATKDALNDAAKANNYFDTSFFQVWGNDGNISDVANLANLKTANFTRTATAKGVVTGTWLNETYNATTTDATVKLGTGANTYNALVSAGATGKDTITLTKDEVLTVDLTGINNNNIDVHYEKNDLVIKTLIQAAGNTSTATAAEFKEIVIKNFKTSLNGDVTLITTTTPGGLDLRDNTAITTFGMSEKVTAKSFTGTKNADVVDATTAVANAAIKTLDGNDIINLGNNTNSVNITGGTGINTVNVTTNTSFGDNIINLTKGENLVIQASDATAYFDVIKADKASDVKIQFYADALHNVKTGSFTLKGLMSKDVLGDLGSVSVVDNAGAGTPTIIKDTLIGGTGTADIATDMATVAKNTFKGTWVNDKVTGSTNADKVTLGAGNNTFIYNGNVANGADEITLTKGENLTIRYNLAGVTAGTNLSDLFTVTKDKNDLLLTSKANTANSIRIKNAASNPLVDTIKLIASADGTTDTKVFNNILDAETLLVDETATVKNGKGTLTGTKLNETLKGDEWNTDGSFKAASNDTIKAVAGDNTVIGGKGTDKLYGGTGSDTFEFAIGDGADEIYNATSADKIKFTTNTVNGASLTKVNNDLIVQAKVGDTVQADTITLKNYFTSTDRVEEILDSNGNAIVKISEALAAMTTTGSGSIKGSEQDDKIEGSEKKDTILSYGGDDTIDGKGGSDVITGGTGKNAVTVAEGYGKTTINLTKGEELTLNWLVTKVGTTVASDNLSDYVTIVEKSGNVTITSKDGKDSVVINGVTKADMADKVVFNLVDKTNSSDKLVTVFIDTATPNNVNYAFVQGDAYKDAKQTLTGTAGNDTLIGGKADDVITTGDGVDTVTGHEKNDTITVNGVGAKTINIGKNDGNDTIKFTSAAEDSKTTIKFTDNSLSEAHKVELVNGKDLVISSITDGTTGKETTISDFVTYSSKIAKIEDSSTGDMLTGSIEVRANGKNYVGAKFNEQFNGTDASGEVFTTGDGSDAIITGGGADTINVNGKGAKTVTVNAGSGNTTINLTGDVLNGSTSTNKVDLIVTGNVNTSAPVYTKVNNNLEITYKVVSGTETADEKVIIKDYFTNLAKVDGGEVKLPNLEVTAAGYSKKDVTAGLTTLVGDLAIDLSGKTVSGSALNENIIGTDAVDNISTGSGKDTVTAGKGNDNISINADGTKTIVFRSALDGEDVIEIADKFNGTVNLEFRNNKYDGSNKPVISGYSKSVDGKDLIITRTAYVMNGDTPTSTETSVKTTIKNYFVIDKTNLTLNGTGSTGTLDIKSAVDSAETSGTLTVDASKETKAVTYIGSESKDVYTGSDKGDTITTNSGDDTLTLGKGADTVNVDGIGTKTINIAGDGGKDTINITKPASVTNVLYSSTKDGLTYVKNGNNLEITRTTVIDAKDVVGTTVLNNVFKADGTVDTDNVAANNITFKDGTNAAVTLSDILTNVSAAKGRLTVTGKSTKVEGSIFNDNITGTDAANQITTGSGNDYVTGGKGNDTITLDGDGAKTIKIAAGDGNDTIVLTSETLKTTGNVTIDLGAKATGSAAGWDASSVKYAASDDGKDLIISYNRVDKTGSEGKVTESQTVTVKGYFGLTAVDASTKLYINDIDVYSAIGSSGLTLDFSKSTKAVTYVGTNKKEDISGSSKADTISTGAGADVIEAGQGDDTIIINGAGAKTINISDGDGNDVIKTDGTFTADTNNEIVVKDKKVKGSSDLNPSFAYGKEGNDLVITRTYGTGEDAVVDGTTKLEGYFDSEVLSKASNFEKTKLNGTALDTTLSSATVNLIGTKEGSTTVYTGSQYADSVVGTDGADKVSALGSGDDTINLGKGNNTVAIASTDSGNKTLVVNRQDGASAITTVEYDETTPGSAVAIVNFVDDTPLPLATPNLTYQKSGRDLTITAKYPDKYNSGSQKVAGEVTQTVVLKNYFTSSEPATVISNAAKIKLNTEDASVISLTAENFTTDKGTALTETIIGTSGNDDIKSVAGADVIKAGAGKDTIDLGTDASATTKTIVLNRTAKGTIDTTEITGAKDNETALLDYGVFDKSKGDTMSYTRKGDDLIVSAEYTKNGSLLAGQNEVTLKDYFAATPASQVKVNYTNDGEGNVNKSISEVIGTNQVAYEVEYDPTALETPADIAASLASFAYDAKVTVSKASTNKVEITGSNYADKYDITVGTEADASSNTGNALNAGAGNDVITAVVNKESKFTVNGGDGDDTITIDAKSDSTVTVNGGAGVDTYTVDGSGSTTISDATGADTYNIKSGTVSITDSDTAVSTVDTYKITGGNVNITDNGGADKYEITTGKAVIDDKLDQADEYKIASTADVIIKDASSETTNTLIVSDKASSDIAAKLLLTKNGNNYDASLVIGGTKISQSYNFTSTASLTDYAQNFSLNDNAAKLITKAELDTAVQTAIQAATAWKVSGQEDGAYSSLFEGSNAKYDSAECTIVLTGTNWA